MRKRHAEFYGIPYQHIPVSKENKKEAEAQQLALLRSNSSGSGGDGALYAGFVERVYRAISAADHQYSSFVFAGIYRGQPHQQAYDSGVKLIGATAHYVTEILDEGPIIEQGVTRISHRDTLEDLVEKGSDLEKMVLSRAVRWHIENRILLYANKTVIFEYRFFVRRAVARESGFRG